MKKVDMYDYSKAPRSPSLENTRAVIVKLTKKEIKLLITIIRDSYTTGMLTVDCDDLKKKLVEVL